MATIIKEYLVLNSAHLLIFNARATKVRYFIDTTCI